MFFKSRSVIKFLLIVDEAVVRVIRFDGSSCLEMKRTNDEHLELIRLKHDW